MIVNERMTKNPITIQASASITELTMLMKENKLKKVPVLDGQKLVGIITEKDVEKVNPSGATLLSVFEIGALLSKTKVKDAMVKDVVTVTPQTPIEDAAIKMRDSRVSALVVLAEGKVVGIITESDMLDSFIDMLGGREEGNRYIVTAQSVPGVIENLGATTNRMGINVSHITFTQCTADGNAELLIRTPKDGRVREVAEEFTKLGYTVIEASVK